MTEVVISGIGQTPVGEHWDISIRALALRAIQAAIADSGDLKPQALFVGNMLSANLSRQAHLGALIADHAGLIGIEAVSIEAAGASGGAALRQAFLAVASRLVNVALVVGVEKTTDCIGPGLESALASGIDADYESIQGLTPTGQAALLTRRYLHDYQLQDDALIGFPIHAHANAIINPNAMFRKAVTKQACINAGLVTDPLNIFDIAPNADGAAALVLTRRDLHPKESPNPLVRISASAMGSDTLALAERRDFLGFTAAQISVDQALQKAGIKLDDVDLFEYHDAYSIFAALSLEAAGFSGRGEGWRLSSDGSLALNGKIPCATFGGLKARGNPIGATGVYQAVEAVLQLRRQAGANQVRGAKIALIQSLGGPASVAVTHILESIQ